MNINSLKKLPPGLIISALFLIIAFIVHSCKKDNNKNETINNDAVNQAKAWYESTYTASYINRNRVISPSAASAKTSSRLFNYSEYIKPDWLHAASYKRFNADVVELPVDPSSVKIGTALGNFPNGATVYSSKYSISSFLLLKDSLGYHAYIMTLIADSAYMANNLAKLDKNKYNKRDPNYSGVVLYYTPDGNYVYGWQYKNGNISLALPPVQLQNGSVATSPDTSSISSVNSIIRLVKLNRDLEVTTCYTWYETNYYEDSNGDMISTGTTILSQECTTEYTITDDDGGGITGTTVSTGGSGGSAPATPPPCIVPAAAQSSAALRNSRLITRVVQNTDGSGFPAPTTTTNPCPEVVTTTTNNGIAVDANPVKPCALAFKNITSSWMAVAVSGYTFGIQDNVFGTKYITFNLQIGMPNYVSVQQAHKATAAAMLVAEAAIATTHGVDFFLSVGAQGTYSKEFANIVQSQLIEELGLPGVIVQNTISAGVPVITYANNNCN